MKSKKKVFTQIWSDFCPNLGEEQKTKKVFTQIWSNFWQNQSASLKQTFQADLLCDQSFCPTGKGGAMPQFCILLLCWFYYPGDPSKYAPGRKHINKQTFKTNHWMQDNWLCHTSPVTILVTKKNRTKGVEMPFMMSVALQVATKLFDQQAAERPILFCNLMRIL